MASDSAARPLIIKSKILLRAWVGRNWVYLDCLNSSEIGSCILLDMGVVLGDDVRDEGEQGKGWESGVTREVGAHLSKNCSESK